MDFLRRLASQEKKLDDSSRFDVVEMVRIPDMLLSSFPSWSDQGLISTLVLTVHLKTYKHASYNEQEL